MIDLSSQLSKYQVATFALISVGNAILFFAVITPNWQVAVDTDVGRTTESGLWMYCPGAGAGCWYIWSDSLINYYEKVDVCRFLLIGDCRQKLLRTPYFFGWHYAVLILLVLTLVLDFIAILAIAYSYFRPYRARLATIIADATLGLGFLLLVIGIFVFMVNGAMLESKYLIGVQNTFEKEYGYSFYLAILAMVVLLFSMIMALVVTTFLFLFVDSSDLSNDGVEEDEMGIRMGSTIDRTSNYVMEQTDPNRKYKMMQEAQFNGRSDVPRYCYSPSEADIPTRTFLSY